MAATTTKPHPGTNRKFVLAARPVGMPKESDFELVSEPLPPLAQGQLLLRTQYLSVDPYMRGRMTGVRTYADPVNIGEIMVGGTVGEVIESRNPDFTAGQIVTGYWGWQEFAVSDGSGLRHLDTKLAPVSTALGVLGMPGMTAYFGLLEICQPSAGEMVVVSGAAGAVGSLVGQIAKIKGCEVVGVTGSDEKVAWLTGELGFDAAFNYKTTSDYVARFQELCPNGVDCYFDNVGGAVSDAVLSVINTKARIAVCGQISQYNLDKPEPGPRAFRYLLNKSARAEGFLVYNFVERFPEGMGQMAKWIKEGKIKYRETIVEGFENAPRALIGVLAGENTGKMIVKLC
ncbi:MAG: NADP-dependent oxidoreductase [Acidobacteriota bacterium]|nr:NADP-dependent oxidoreductase [Acidobacteriota bacterium]